MKLHGILLTVAFLATALLSQVLKPTTLMARDSARVDLETGIPKQFGEWRALDGVGVVTPSDNPDYVETGPEAERVYSKELSRAYVNRAGEVVMFLVAYGPVQNHRLKAHRPEFCYAAAGFNILGKSATQFRFGQGQNRSVAMTRLVTRRETRLEPVSYWLRTGDDIASDIIGQQLTRLKYALKGVVPDGALVRISTVGLAAEPSFALQEKFMRELLSVVGADTRRLMLGSASA